MIFVFIAFLYSYFLRFITTDLIMNLFYLIYGFIKIDRNEIKKDKDIFLDIKKANSDIIKDEWMVKRYVYKHDPLYGIIDWFPRFLSVLIIRSFKGDCDDMALMSKYMYGDGKLYSILPYHIKNWGRMHVVYVRKNKVYSSGIVHNMSLDKYLSIYYKDVDYLKMVII
jgi:hypothetical protein